MKRPKLKNPHEVIDFLEWLKEVSVQSVTRYDGMPPGIADEYVAGMKLYWQHVAAGLSWAISHAEVFVSAERKRKK